MKTVALFTKGLSTVLLVFVLTVFMWAPSSAQEDVADEAKEKMEEVVEEVKQEVMGTDDAEVTEEAVTETATETAEETAEDAAGKMEETTTEPAAEAAEEVAEEAQEGSMKAADEEATQEAAENAEADKEMAAEAEQKSLYERLGGYDAISAVVDDFFKRMIPDEQLGRFFIGLSTDSKKRVQQLTVDYICSAAGGPCTYTGRDMVTSHAGLNINESDWELSAKYLVETLDKFNVPAQEQADVLNFVGSLKGAIVEQPAEN